MTSPDPHRLQHYLDKLKDPHAILLLLTLVVMLIGISPAAKNLRQFFTEDSLFAENSAFINKAEEDVTLGFVKLAALEGIFDTISTARVGVEFFVDANIVIGKQIGILRQLAEKGLYYSGIAAMGVALLKVMTYIAHSATPYLFYLTLLFTLSYAVISLLGFHEAKRKVFIGLRLMLGFFVFAHLVIPYTVHATAFASVPLTDSQSKPAVKLFSRIHGDLSAQYKGKGSQDQAKSLINNVESLSARLEQNVRTLFVSVTRYLIAEVVATIVIPFGLMALLALLTRSLFLRYIVHP